MKVLWKQNMVNLRELILQYWNGLMFIVFFIFALIASHNLVYAFGAGIVVYALLYKIGQLKYLRSNPKCKILYLNRNEICMKTQFQNRNLDTKKRKVNNDYEERDKQDCSKIEDIYWNDFELILQYAKAKNYTTLKIITHLYIATCLLRKIVHDNTYNEIRKMTLNEKMKIHFESVEMEINYRGMYINRCARYQYGLFLSGKEFKKTLRKMKFYEIIIHLNSNDAI